MVSILNTTKQHPPITHEGVLRIKNSILGKKYELSVVFIGDYKARKLNKQYRNKNYNPNILSFPLDDTEGEIFINPHVAKRQAPKFEMSYKKYLAFLIIHGCLHLQGMDHGEKMDQAELDYLEQLA